MAPCRNCPDRDSCTELCEKARKAIPSEEAGKSRRIVYIDLDLSRVTAPSAWVPARHVPTLTPPQVEALTRDQLAVYELVREEWSLERIATALRRSPGAVRRICYRIRAIAER